MMSFLLILCFSFVMGGPVPEIPKQQITLQQQQHQQRGQPQSSLNSLTNNFSQGINKTNFSFQPHPQITTSQPQVYTRQQPQPMPIINGNSEVSAAPELAQSQIFTHISAGAPFQQTNGYVVTVNPNQSFPLQPNQTPIIMQYIPQPGGGPSAYQYVQLIPPRPVVLPYQQYVSPNSNPFLPSVPQSPSNSLSSINAGNSLNSPPIINVSPPVSQFSSTQAQQFPSYNPIHAAPLIGGYSNQVSSLTVPQSSPYFNNIQSRFQLVNGPGDLSLNTNEYFPSQLEGGFKAIRGRN